MFDTRIVTCADGPLVGQQIEVLTTGGTASIATDTGLVVYKVVGDAAYHVAPESGLFDNVQEQTDGQVENSNL